MSWSRRRVAGLLLWAVGGFWALYTQLDDILGLPDFPGKVASRSREFTEVLELMPGWGWTLLAWTIILGYPIAMLVLHWPDIRRFAQRRLPKIYITWPDATDNMALASAQSHPNLSTMSIEAREADKAPPPFRVGLAPDGEADLLIHPVPQGGEPYVRSEPFDVDILVTYAGTTSAKDITYFYALDPEVEGHPDESGEPKYQRLPTTGKLCASFEAPFQHDGITSRHTLRISVPYKIECQPIWVSIHASDLPKFETILHLHVSPGFPHVKSDFRALMRLRCRA